MPSVDFSHGTSWLELNIEGYEFPVLPNDSANWLVVAGKAAIDGREWTFRHPCLETTDVERLAIWLEAVGQGLTANEACWFTEPNLDFQLLSAGELRVNFSLESSPPWGLDLQWPACGFNFPINGRLLQAADNLRLVMKRFPTRDFDRM